MSDNFLEELTADFIEQVTYSLDECEEAFLNLENSPEPGQELTQIFRLAHSIKGGSAVLGLDDLSHFAHIVEDLLSILRTYPQAVDSDVVSALLVAVDKFKERIEHLRHGEMNHPWDTHEISEKVLAKTKTLEATYGIQQDDASPQSPPPQPEAAEAIKPKVHISADSPSSEKITPPEDSSRSKKIVASTVKVDTARIDSVLDLVGELVVIKSQLLQEVQGDQSAQLKLISLMDQLDGMVRDLYDRSLSMRMTSLKPLFVKVQRVLRDLSVRLDKPIDLQVSGEGTEIDRTMIETLTDPLIHIARNAIDHGLENREDRSKSNKDTTATIVFRAYQEGGSVIIEFKDDGKGISPDRVKQKAIDNGVISEDTASKMPDEEAVNLIFAPGFSTADVVSDISGRGVGLDVVRTNIEKIKGNITVKSKVNEGTCFRISIPLTTAIIDGMVMISEGITYILPVNNVKELLQFSKVNATETGTNSNVIFSRGKYIPIINLKDILPMNSDIDLKKIQSIGPNNQKVNNKTVVIVEHNSTEFALVVDEVVGKGQFVIKNLGGAFENTRGITGGSIMGDGKVSLILDVNGIYTKYLTEYKNQHTHEPERIQEAA